MPEGNQIDTGLKDRVVLVTDAYHGIGADMAKAFAAEGAAVFITYLCLPIESYEISAAEVNTPLGEALYSGGHVMPL